LGLGGCATLPREEAGTPPPLAEDFVGQTVAQRTWFPARELAFDPIRLGETIPLSPLPVHAKLVGANNEDAVASLAAKLWLIDNAHHSIDLVYYIFARDEAGYAVLGALCNAVRRGVDVRMMIDSVGSLSATHAELRGLQSCAEEAGHLTDPEGRPTTHRARAQVAIINPLSSPFVRWNRRSHDKLLVVDGHQRELAYAMTGGRNVSLDYYGIDARGERDPHAFQDAELLVRARNTEGMAVGDAATYYYSLLFLQPGTRLLDPPRPGSQHAREQRLKAEEALARVRAWPLIRDALARMPGWLNEGAVEADVRMAHELGNLYRQRAVRGVQANLEANRNSIQRQWIEMNQTNPPKHLRIVSPYFFFAQYRLTQRGPAFDGAATLLALVEQNRLF
jgi:phosphatidylserine/phosphatidylglycerophosphate/cardiolipin synthase-like enzyme